MTQRSTVVSASAPEVAACDSCLARTWLIARLAGHLDTVRNRIGPLLALGDSELIAAVGGHHKRGLYRELAEFDPERARRTARDRGVALLCRCGAQYPLRLRSLENPPAVLHVAGDLDRFLALAEADPVALVGARRASSYGLEVARSLGQSLGRAGITVVSGMALGIDSAAHAGALAAGAGTLAVLPGAAECPYPPAKRALHRQIISLGAAVAELPPGTAPRRWAFPARNRIIAALALMTIIVEAGEHSGALLTAGFARSIGRQLGAVPGRVTSPTARGPNALLVAGAYVVRDAQDVLDLLFGAGVRRAEPEQRPTLTPELRGLLEAVAGGRDTVAALERAGFPAEQVLAALAALELEGYIRREPGGRFSPTASAR